MRRQSPGVRRPTWAGRRCRRAFAGLDALDGGRTRANCTSMVVTRRMSERRLAGWLDGRPAGLLPDRLVIDVSAGGGACRRRRRRRRRPTTTTGRLAIAAGRAVAKLARWTPPSV
uniref:Uncharacterized protein n=1 Tax=Plectus sambesii TaxID=2011161 RepID=A0A914VST4_9BILA